MASLQFQRRYRDLIVANKKTQTLRAKLPRGVRVGGPLTMLNGYHASSKFATATCSSVDCVAIEDLTEADARRDGFASLRDLLDALRDLYGVPAVYRIRWRDLSLVRQ